MTLAFTSWSFDKPLYNPGDPVTLTVEFTSDDVDTSSVASAVTVVLTDAAGSATQASDASGNFPDLSVSNPDTPQPVTASASDTRPGTWSSESVVFTGTAAPFAGTAILTSTA